MELKAYSKNDLLQKLAQSGFFVDYLTLDSFLEKYKIEAIFEDENGNEFFDVSSYNILVQNVLKKSVESIQEQEQSPVQSPIQSSVYSPVHSYIQPDVQSPVQSPAQPNTQAQETVVMQTEPAAPAGASDNAAQTGTEQSVSQEAQGKKPERTLLESIKWYRWDDISSDIADAEQKDDAIIVDGQSQTVQNGADTPYEDNESIPIAPYQNISQNEQKQSASTYPQMLQFGTSAANRGAEELQTQAAQQSEAGLSEHMKNEISKIAASNDDNEEDFDDIALISESLQAQEKFQKYIADEIARNNLSVLEAKRDNAFKFDISEKTLNMIARTIAKKIAKQVSVLLTGEKGNNAKLLEYQSKYSELEVRAKLLEEQNKKLKLLLAESNKNLNSYKPTFFGLYRFVRKKNKKRS